MRSCTPEELAAALRAGEAVFDTRPPGPRARARWPGMRPLPLAAVQHGELPDVPKDRPVFLVCERGLFSELVGLYLESEGFLDVRHLPGGLRSVLAAPGRAGEPAADPG